MLSVANDMPVFDRHYHIVLILFTTTLASPPFTLACHMNKYNFSLGISSVLRNTTIKSDVVFRTHKFLYFKH